MQEAIIAFTGVVLGFFLTVCWDKYKNYRKYKDLVKLLVIELEQNSRRMTESFDKLPNHIKQKFNTPDGSVQLTDEELSSLGWSFPKPYITEAWKTFILSGLTVELPADLARKLYKLYDEINSINFLGDLSVRLFQILAQQNRLDQETNKNFDRFCKIGTLSLQVAMRESAGGAVVELKKLV